MSRCRISFIGLLKVETMNMVKVWQVTVQDLKKPYGFAKLKILKEVDESSAKQWYERSIKHVHIDKYVVWVAVAIEKELGVSAKTYLYFEGLCI